MLLSRSFFRGVVIAVVVCNHGQPSHAATKTWDNGAPNNFWDEDDNWDPDEKPQPTDDAVVGGNPEVNTLEIFNDLENNGTIGITTGTLQPQGDTTNNGTINIGDGSAILSQLILSNAATLSGSGEVVLKNSDDLVGSNAVIRGGFIALDAVTNGASHTVRGEGSVLQHWINEGVFRAEETSGDSSAVLLLDGGSFVNNGELRSSSGATITFINAAYSQGVSGQLIADTDNISFNGITSVTGGSIESIGGGVFEIADGNNTLTLSGVTVNAPIDNTNAVGNARVFGDSGGITNNSTMTLDGQSAIAQFGFISSGALGGTGEIVLVSGDANTFIGVFTGVPFEFTQGASHTIRGAGRIESPIINNGTIRAEPGTNGAILLVNKTQTNNGLMEAGAGATLEFQGGVSDTVQGATGVISAANGGTVELEGTSITGGRLETTGTGTITVTGLSTVTNVTNAGTLGVLTFKTLRVDGGTLTNDGTISINSDGGGAPSTLQARQDTLLGGAGEVFLNGFNNSSRSDIAPNGFTITHDTNHTVRGDGQIIGTGTFINNGRIEGDSAADPVRIRTRLEGTGTLKDVSIDFDFSGTVHAPGNSVGTVALEGSYAITHPLVHLEIEVGGLTAGTEHDSLDSTGSVSLGGTLDVLAVDLGNSYVPIAGDRFEIINSTSAISNTFNSVNFPDILGARSVTWLPVDYATNPNKVFLEIATVDFLSADFDEDGDVDNADLAKWETGYGIFGGAGHMDGDADGDFDVDGADFLTWQQQFGIGVPSPAVAPGSSAVPEPKSIALLTFALIIATSNLRPRSSLAIRGKC